MNDEMDKEQMEEMVEVIGDVVPEVSGKGQEEVSGIDTPAEAPDAASVVETPVTPVEEPVVAPVVEGAPDPRTVTPAEAAPDVTPAAEDVPVELADMEPEALRELVGTLRGQLNTNAGSFFGTTHDEAPAIVTEPKPGEPAVKPVAPAAEAAPAVEPPPAAKVWEDKNFLGDTPIDEFLDSRDKLNALLNAVAKQASESSPVVDTTALKTETLRGIPEVVGKFVSGMLAMRTMANEFYEVNQDLKPFRNIVAAAANSLSSQHTDWTMGQVMSEAATLSRKTLGLRAAAISRTIKETPPGTRPGGVRRPQTPTMTGLQKEIDTVLNLE